MKKDYAVDYFSTDLKAVLLSKFKLTGKARMKMIFTLPNLFVLIFLAGAFSVIKADPADSLLNIGHASMKVKTSDGKVIYIDPFHTPGDYSDSADIILVTHSHQDHNNIGLVKQKSNCTVITYAEANLAGVFQHFSIGNIKIYSVPAYNTNHNRNSCVGYVIEFNGIKLYHAGDTGKIPEMSDLADSSITYALLPCDGVFNMGPAEATQAAEAIQADYSIPIHTEPPPDNYNENIVALFTPANRLLVRNGETIALRSPATDVRNKSNHSIGFKLFQNYPNPFNPKTRIYFTISRESFVTLKIYDLNGREITELFRNVLSGGDHMIEWNADNFSSGIYFIRLQADNFIDIKKCVLMK